ncbi:MAG: hypothetical protein JOY61_02070, partial [Chloroflexi bacterium]|nr:hypothetical protein [Chloroflexota bacterium]
MRSVTWRDAARSRDFAIGGVAVALFVFFYLMNSRMAAETTLVALARTMAPIGIVAAGMTFLFVAGEIDLSVGGLYGLLMVIISILIEKRNFDPWLAMGMILL